jgi:hypothetical protein
MLTQAGALNDQIMCFSEEVPNLSTFNQRQTIWFPLSRLRHEASAAKAQAKGCGSLRWTSFDEGTWTTSLKASKIPSIRSSQ